MCFCPAALLRESWWFLKRLQESLLFLLLRSLLPRFFERCMLCFLHKIPTVIFKEYYEHLSKTCEKALTCDLKIREALRCEDRVALWTMWRGLHLKLWYHDKLWSKKEMQREENSILKSMKKYRTYITTLQCKKVELNRLKKDKNRKYKCPVQLAVYSQTVEGTIYLTILIPTS